MFCRVFVDGHRSYQSDGHFDSNLLGRLYPVITPELVGTVLVQSAGTDHAPDLLDALGCILILRNRRLLHRLPQRYAELVRSHNSALVIDPLAAYKSNTPQKPDQQSMAALRDLASVADATSYLADDIPVPYYPDQEPETDWMATKLEAVEDFLREQEVYSPSIRRTQPNPEAATATSTAKGKERARLPAVKTEPAADHGPACFVGPDLRSKLLQL
ncbi:hypothetical protein PCASD_20416 [Puccinia coronata f. sp. avenae]|uniref:Uncharacterized protein n=1 Tax=Puccinia coronata f. sp. avenae TaxID=200324 RepID=A0A2N5U1V5_9BASI|nr:hypothetical protein PCASD_20416 [Puccinia coronata f. sp. avenae]